MQRFWPVFRRSIRATAVALLITVLVMGLLFGLFIAFVDGFTLASAKSGWTIALATAVVAAIVGAGPAIFFGGLSYAGLAYSHRATYLSAGLVGALPGVLFGIIGHPFGLLFILFGLPCALLTHQRFRHYQNKRPL